MNWYIFIGSVLTVERKGMLAITDYRGTTSRANTDWPPYLNSPEDIKVMVF